MNYPGLAMSRSFGDKAGREVGVISEPEIMKFDICEEDKFIIIASDGVWEFLSSEEVFILFSFNVYFEILGCSDCSALL